MSKEYRLEIIKKIKEYEKKGLFNEDVENDPATIELKPSDVRYLNTNIFHKINRDIANKIAITYIRKLIKNNKLIIDKVIGLENLINLNEGCFLTCNHFNPFDNFALHEVLYKYVKGRKRRFYKIIREGNYSFKGIYGYFFRNCETLPLSSNFETMKKFTKSLGTILEGNNIVLIYPEQAMWWNYKKPRPLKPGAYKYAVKFNKPIVPCFITMSDSEFTDDAGFNVQKYTIFFDKPIYPNKELDKKSQSEDLCNRNYEIWKKIYEEFYNCKLTYECEENL